MPRRPPVAVALLGLLTTAACATGSGQGVSANDVPVNSVNNLSTSTLVACAALKVSLPKLLVAGAPARTVTPVSDTTAAWGTPPITLRCGVPAGRAADDPYTFNGVAWAQHDDGRSRSWTTTGRKTNVVVEVPNAYDNQAALIGSLAKAITDTLS